MLFQTAKFAQHAIPTKFVFTVFGLLLSEPRVGKPNGRVRSRRRLKREYPHVCQNLA